jgi:hypothetical protein
MTGKRTGTWKNNQLEICRRDLVALVRYRAAARAYRLALAEALSRPSKPPPWARGASSARAGSRHARPGSLAAGALPRNSGSNIIKQRVDSGAGSFRLDDGAPIVALLANLALSIGVTVARLNSF